MISRREDKHGTAFFTRQHTVQAQRIKFVWVSAIFLTGILEKIAMLFNTHAKGQKKSQKNRKTPWPAAEGKLNHSIKKSHHFKRL